MAIPTTGIVFLFGAFIYFYLSRRFWNYYKAENNRIAKLFALAFFLLAMGFIVPSVFSLFLIENRVIWWIICPIYEGLISLGGLVIAYTVASVRFPKYLPFYIALISIALIIYVILLVIYPPFYSYINGSLNWELEKPLIIGGMSFLGLGLLIFVPAAIVFFQEVKRAKEKKIKIRSIGLGLTMIWMLLVIIVDFFLLNIFKLPPVYSDLNWFTSFLLLAITLLLTWGSPRPKWVKKVE